MSSPTVTNLSPSVHVSELPPSNGRAKDAVQQKVGHLDITTRFGSLTGSVTVSTIKQDLLGPTVNLEISTERGRVRAYLMDGKEYRYIEAAPGSPAQTRGDLIYGGGYWLFRLEAVDGEAAGVTYHVWRS
ncbi:MAG TPA: hypothetical protein VKE22_00955 [Haliangiales bacterium]|nr:hypothetical protein [Haliangiales bacterium]